MLQYDLPGMAPGSCTTAMEAMMSEEHTLTADQHYVIKTTTDKLAANLDTLAGHRRPIVSVTYIGGRDWIIVGGPTDGAIAVATGATVNIDNSTASSGAAAIVTVGDLPPYGRLQSLINQALSHTVENPMAWEAQVELNGLLSPNTAAIQAVKDVRESLVRLAGSSTGRLEHLSDRLSSVVVQADNALSALGRRGDRTMQATGYSAEDFESLAHEVAGKCIQIAEAAGLVSPSEHMRLLGQQIVQAVYALNMQQSAADLSSWLNDPDVRVMVDGKGYGWRVYEGEGSLAGYHSMIPTNPDNSPTPEPYTFFVKDTGDLIHGSKPSNPDIGVNVEWYDGTAVSHAGFIEDKAQTWIIYLDRHGVPEVYWPRRQKSGAVIGESVPLKD